MKYLVYVIFLMLSLNACSNSDAIVSEDIDEEIPAQQDVLPNILLIIADDFGLDACPGYPIGSEKPNMPNLSALMQTGIAFNNMWSNPTCTPTRATIITGKYGFKTNVLEVDDVLSTAETSIQTYLDANTNNAYNHAVIGKWHLSRSATHPNAIGVNHFAGFSGGGVSSYTDWNLIVNGNSTASSDYTTSKFTDLAVDWIAQQSQPWFLWLAYNAPHTPFHLPPSDLHERNGLIDDVASINANPLPYYLAALEAMDTEMGRLFNSMTTEERENTIIIFVGDNGTPGQVAQSYNSRRAKGNIYEGGINVPLIISGKGVSRMGVHDDALLNTTDLFATIADIAGTGTSEIHDSKSFKHLFDSNDTSANRSFIYAENEDIAIRNTGHKYIRFNDGSEAFYDLGNDPLETLNLLNTNQLPLSTANEAIKTELVSELNRLRN